ncbi:MAG: cyclic pyranopterin monophosphate synthase MoaC [Fervidicoccaceae archaeon]|nr:cyclic pyranopterin monophosphate synthase MoaC [Fervidicoccaceae archaeon]MCC6052415.1 cyclic pyranopterin monophosphate synthase MoaC [Fervidicoccaceae archaeon]
MSTGPRMIDISDKPPQLRVATAEGVIKLRPETLRLIKEGKIEKGDPVQISTIAAIMAVKKTPEIVPLAHPILIEGVQVEHVFEEPDKIRVRVTVKSHGKTGVEMEALVGVSAALLAIWDVVKKYEKDDKGEYPFTSINEIRVLEKKKT